MAETADRRVVHNAEKLRYEVYSGDQLAGFTQYYRTGDATVFTHTEIDDAFGGQGLGKVLAAEALDDVVRSGGTIVPLCEFIAGYIAKNEAAYEGYVRRPR